MPEFFVNIKIKEDLIIRIRERLLNLDVVNKRGILVIVQGSFFYFYEIDYCL